MILSQKSKFLMICVTIFTLIGACGAGVYKIVAKEPAQKSSHLLQVADLPQRVEQPIATLIGGRTADPNDWPASMYAAMNGGRCTSTLVGQRTLLIAAHCVDNGAKATFRIKNVIYSSTCEHSPAYVAGNATADWALCVVDKTVTGVEFEIVNQDNAAVKVGDEVLLTGFGCVQPGGGGGNDGTYRVGEATVTDVPNGGDSNDIITKGGGALCFGDSGGPAFKFMDADKKTRVQISVNSRGDIRTESFLSSVSTDQAREFFKSWSKKHDQKICGVHVDALGCRGTGDAPTSPCRKAYDGLGACLMGKNRLMLTELEMCQKTYAQLFSCLEQAAWDDKL